MGINLPSDSERLGIVGKTGSGKTQAAAWHLSIRRFDLMPWIVYDFKMDELLNSIPGVEHIDVSSVPTKPGVYLVHPHPDDIAGVSRQMSQIWAQENTGVYCDEGYMVCGPGRPNPWFRSLLTQGRSKRIPMIILSQRPVWLDRFVFSESEFYQVFGLNDKRDIETIQEYVPAKLTVKLPKYHSYYYDVAEDKVVVLTPVPDATAIKDSFAARFETMREKPKLFFV
jgi:hypothetical protein